MKKLNVMVLACVAALALTAQAQTAGTDSQTAAADAQAAAAAHKEQLLKGGKMSAKQKAELAKAERGDANLQAGASFLAANKAKPGVVSLPSGVQYKIVTKGSGKTPAEQSSVRVRYVGTLVDGSGFDKIEDKKPAPLRVSGLLPGLREALKLMPVGSKWEVVVPPSLAYGAQGYRNVGPNAVLMYSIELLGID